MPRRRSYTVTAVTAVTARQLLLGESGGIWDSHRAGGRRPMTNYVRFPNVSFEPVELQVGLGEVFRSVTPSFLRKEEEEDEFLTSCCPHITWRQRVTGWLCCFSLGLLLQASSFGSLTRALFGHPGRFAMTYTLGNIVALVGTFFLADALVAAFHWSHLRFATAGILVARLAHASAIFVSAMVLTLVAVEAGTSKPGASLDTWDDTEASSGFDTETGTKKKGIKVDQSGSNIAAREFERSSPIPWTRFADSGSGDHAVVAMLQRRVMLIGLCAAFGVPTRLTFRGERLLELGAGTGYVGLVAAALGHCVTLTDPWTNMAHWNCQCGRLHTRNHTHTQTFCIFISSFLSQHASNHAASIRKRKIHRVIEIPLAMVANGKISVERSKGPWAESAAVSAQGPRPQNEDMHVMLCSGLPEGPAPNIKAAGLPGLFDDLPEMVSGPSLPEKPPDSARCPECLFAVFDGHGGQSAAKACAERFPTEIREAHGSCYEVAGETKDHTPNAPEEEKRIKAAGGFLGCSRALGDFRFKEDAALVSAEISSAEAAEAAARSVVKAALDDPRQHLESTKRRRVGGVVPV
eukprot:Skav230349  [mRNA]  locus=scaffold1251:20431:45400:- [translate_table: standard]